MGRRYLFERAVPVHRVPQEWDHVVCICALDHGDASYVEGEHHFAICTRCHKLARYYTSNCRKCGKFYLRVFRHPVDDAKVNYCYECCLTVENYSSKHAAVPPLDKFRYPRRLKTPEELADELDSLLSFEF